MQKRLTGKYSINDKMTLLNLTTVIIGLILIMHSSLYKMMVLISKQHLPLNRNRNFNSWNLDLSYSWWFAPASELSILYRNYAQEGSRNVERRSTQT
jgi:hypothetical protein